MHQSVVITTSPQPLNRTGVSMAWGGGGGALQAKELSPEGQAVSGEEYERGGGEAH